jgi:hypothetical protein
MLVRGRGSPEPGVVGDRHQKICTFLDESSAEIWEDNLKADENAKLTLRQGEIEDLFSRLKVSNSFPQRPYEEQKILQGDILTKRDEVDFVILSRQFP